MKIKIFIIAILLSILTIGFSELNINYQILEKELYPNSIATLVITLQNPTKEEIKSINLIFESENKNIQITPYTFEIEKLGPSYQFTQNFLIKIGENADTSNIRLYVSYYIGTEKKSFFINIPIRIIKFPIILINNITFSEEYLEPGKGIKATIELYNNGYSSARNLKIKILNLQFFAFQKDEEYINEIKVGESVRKTFYIYSNPSIEIGYYNIPILISYYNEDYSKVFNETKSFSIKVFGKPKIDIFLESLSYDFITIKIANTGISKAKNIFVKYDEKSFFIEELLPGDYDTFEIESKKRISFNISYLDSLNNRYNEIKTIDIDEEILRSTLNTSISKRFPQINRSGDNTKQNLTLLIFLVAATLLIIIFVYIFFKKRKKSKK
ncbi:MAG: hypothetical protein QXT38_00900 [Candidatus Aenigmatarchaeota archaeon]